jgi:hypothetical protein
MKSFLLSVLSLVCLYGCAPARIIPVEKADQSNRATVMVFRESEFNAGGADAIVGAEGKDWVRLETKSFVELQLKPGRYEFFVRAKLKKEPFILAKDVEQSANLCLRVIPNPANLAAAMVPIAGLFTGSTFILEGVACPSAEGLAQFTKAEVTYAEK